MNSESQRFGLWTLTFLVVANMVGAGIFTTSGFTLGDLKSPALVVTAWFVAGLIAICGAISYGHLIRAMPESGGEYLFLARAVHPLFGFIAGWVSLIAGFTGAIAFSATAFESYALPSEVRPAWLPEDAVAVCSILLCGIFHGLRPVVGTWFQNLAVILKLGLLALFLLVAMWQGPLDGWKGEALPGLESMTTTGIAFAFANSLVWISLSYMGFNAAVYVAEEAADIRKTIPRSLLFGTCVVVVLYVMLNSVFVFAPPSEAVAGKADVATIAAQYLGGETLARFVRGIVAVALLTSVSSMLMAAPRVYAKMASDGLLPSILQFRGHAPTLAVFAQVVLAVIIVVVSDLQEQLNYLGLTLSLSAACSVCCLFVPAVREKLERKPGLAPAVYVIATLVAATLTVMRDIEQNNYNKLWATPLTFAVGAAMYLIAVAVRRPESVNKPGDKKKK